MKTTQHPPGIAPLPDGSYRVYARVRGQYVSKVYPADTPLEGAGGLKEAREALKVDERRRQDAGQAAAPPDDGTFRAAALRYLRAVTAMPTYTERVRDIALWVAEFGGRPPQSITPAEIRAVRDRWLTVGPKMVQRWATTRTSDPKTGKLRRARTWEPTVAPLSASVVNHRLRALENLYSVLANDKHARNPVRQVPEAEETQGPPRALPLEVVRAILAALPESKVKARLLTLAWTGIPPMTLQRMDATMVHAATSSAWVPGRKKGKGGKGREMPLAPDGLAALQEVIRQDAFTGANRDRSNMRRAFRLACQKVMKEWTKKGVEGVDLTRCTPYALRHSIAALVYHRTGDIKATGGLLGVTAKTAERYAAAAIDPRLTAAVAAVSEALNPPEPKPVKARPKLHEKLHRRKKAKKH